MNKLPKKDVLIPIMNSPLIKGEAESSWFRLVLIFYLILIKNLLKINFILMILCNFEKLLNSRIRLLEGSVHFCKTDIPQNF